MIERKIVKALPSSFVASNMKLAGDRGSGEAKLWVGQMSNSDELDSFFGFDEGYTYSFSKDNLLIYLNQVKIEYIYQKFNNYKDASLTSWDENYSLIESLDENKFTIHLIKFTDTNRYYIRADEEIFKKTFRRIAIPKLTNIVFEKDTDKKHINLKLELNLELEKDNEEDGNISSDVLNHNLFGIHIKEKNTALSEENPHICIGWSALGDLSSISTKEELVDIFAKEWPKAKSRAQRQNVGQVWRFVNDMQIGDYVVFADGNVFHIGKIESDYYYDDAIGEDQSSDYKNSRKVVWLKKNIQRSEVSDSLHHSLMTAMTVWTMNDYRAAIADLLNGIYIKDQDDAETEIEISSIRFSTGYQSKFARNRIVFGAPGTGKSFTINKERKELLGSNNETDYERVTFHPDYSYANFVGTYKPIPSIDSEGKDTITYAYVPGPFMRVYVDALKNSREDLTKPYLLIIEEINRANVAAVFGDIFQLLDRKGNVSEYPIQASEDIKAYLAKELGGAPENYAKIRIPDNMFIWATMNSADQGVFPMDTAFKRRWDFTYLGINDNDKDIQGKSVEVGSIKKQFIEWNSLRKAINDYLASEKINEDKQLGPYFISRNIVVPDNGDEIDNKRFCDVFKHKVLMYLFDDAAKQKRNKLFEGCKGDKTRYSEICKGFDEQGIGIFNSVIQNQAKPRDLETDNIELDENGMPKYEE